MILPVLQLTESFGICELVSSSRQLVRWVRGRPTHLFYRQRNQGPSWDVTQVSCLQPRILHPTPASQVTCESDSQVGPTLPAFPRWYDSSTFPVTHTARHSSYSQQARHWAPLPSFSHLSKAFRENSCTSSWQTPPSYRRANRDVERECNCPIATQPACSTARWGPRHPGTQPSPCLFPTGSPSPGLPLKGG